MDGEGWMGRDGWGKIEEGWTNLNIEIAIGGMPRNPFAHMGIYIYGNMHISRNDEESIILSIKNKKENRPPPCGQEIPAAPRIK